MKQQNGCIRVEGESWCLYYRESVNTESGPVRKLRSKTLGPVTAEHRRNKDRSTGKLRIPAAIQEQADAIMAAVNGRGPDKALISAASHLMSTVPVLAQKLVGLNKVSQVKVVGALSEIMERSDRRMRISDVVEDFFSKRKDGLSFASVKVYEYAWKHMRDKIGHRIMADFDRGDASELWQQIHDESPHLRIATFAAMRGFMASLFSWAADKKLYKGENPSKGNLPDGIPGRRETEAYYFPEIIPMLNDIFSDKPMIQTIIAFGFAGGLSVSEMTGLRWEDYERTETGALLHVRRASYRGRIGKTKNNFRRDDSRIGVSFCEFVDAYRASLGNPTEGFIFSNGGNKPIRLEGVARNFIRPRLNYCSECERRYGDKKRVGEYGTKLNHVDSADELGMFPDLEDHLYQPRSAVLPDWKGFHAMRRGTGTFLATLQKEAESRGITADELAASQLRHGDVGTTRSHYIKGRTKQDDRIAAARKVIEINERRNVAAGALSEGLSKAVQ